MLLRIRVTPNARRSEILGWQEDPVSGRVLKIRIAASPTEGKANTALQVFLAKSLGIPKSQVRLAKGAASRIKSFEIPDGTTLPE
jgi:uncharacterized protein (TIGR00251 family)